jgi:hypothetical protein
LGKVRHNESCYKQRKYNERQITIFFRANRSEETFYEYEEEVLCVCVYFRVNFFRIVARFMVGKLSHKWPGNNRCVRRFRQSTNSGPSGQSRLLRPRGETPIRRLLVV